MENKLKVVSNDKNLRLCIIENSIFIEELISEVIGRILNIEWKESKSFGFGSSSLSFNQKVQIILDIKGVDKENLKRLMTLMHIRNKFAHVSHIKTFDDFFSKTKVGKQVKSDFKRWFFDENGDSDIPERNREKIYRLLFYLLVDKIAEFLFDVYGNHMYALGEKAGRKEMNERLQNEFLQALKKLNGGKEALLEIFEKLEKEK
ncbi:MULTISPECIES: hypothetical protein [Flavobacteriaceae]|uniref:hypothetical protein n=1 Tax=Flavobacteriaceae TaxID=49546 RepID=UPI001490F6F3|nr:MULTISPECIES: hypothetical protein [Allomuricauda]MDC6367522.1 hypothetical protein [Muricauda sp. AC10]